MVPAFIHTQLLLYYDNSWHYQTMIDRDEGSLLLSPVIIPVFSLEKRVYLFSYHLFSLEKKGILILYQSRSIVRLSMHTYLRTYVRQVSCKCITS